MKHYIPYIVAVVFEIILGLIYCFLPYDKVPALIYFFSVFVPFFILYLSLHEKNSTKKVIKILIISVIFSAVSIAVFTRTNQICGKFIAEYNVTVESINGRGSGSASFTKTDGSYGKVDLMDERVMIFDEKKSVDIGDVITIREYRGLFGKTYYIFVEEVKP